MAEFTPITTQEELDAVIKDRVERAKESERKKYSDYDAIKKERDDLRSEKAGFTEALQGHKDAAAQLQKDLDAERLKSSGLERDAIRTRVAIKTKLPLELRDRLRGATEEEIEADAAELVKMVGARKAQPLRDPEGAGKGDPDKTREALIETLRKVKGE